MTNLIIHRRDKENAGDMASSPKQYFSWLGDWDEIDIVDVGYLSLDDRHIILGGGGLFYPDFEPYLQIILDSNPKSLTIWGIGRNRHGDDSNKIYPDIGQALIDKADLVGLRDCRIEPDWVPCPSVHHLMFDIADDHTIRSKESGGILAFQHRESRFAFKHPSDWESIKSQGNLWDLLRSIEAAELVCSSSYHGCLWATLFGRKTMAVDTFSQKFSTGLPESVKLISSAELSIEDPEMLLGSISANLTFKREARLRSFAFASKVRKLVGEQ